MKSVVIIPTYNERENIEKLINEILNLGVETEILIIDDSSPDGTGKMVDRVSQQCPRVSIIHRKRKLGIGSAYLCGFKYALSKNFDYIFTMDADFSHSPKYLPEFINKIQDFDVVIGSRYVRGGSIVNWGILRRILSRSANVITKNLLNLKFSDYTSGFRCYRARVLKNIDFNNIYSDGYSFLIEILYRCEKSNYRIKESPISFTQRLNGTSKISRGEIAKAVITLLRLKMKEIMSRGNGFGY